MSISKKLRFEVFKRDDFQCQYCGKSSPHIVLEIDHIIPKSEGGENNLENLTTSCFNCNRGKGKALLEDYREGTDPTEQAVLLLERERQLKEYNEVVKIARKRKLNDYDEISRYWKKSFPGFNFYWFPSGLINRALDFIPKEKILEAIDTCKFGHRKEEGKSWGESIRSYFFGIIKNLTNNFGKDD